MSKGRTESISLILWVRYLRSSCHLMQNILRNTLFPLAYTLVAVLLWGATNHCPPRQSSLELMSEVTPSSVLSSPSKASPVLGMPQMVGLTEHSLFSSFQFVSHKMWFPQLKAKLLFNQKLSLHKMDLADKTKK